MKIMEKEKLVIIYFYLKMEINRLIKEIYNKILIKLTIHQKKKVST